MKDMNDTIFDEATDGFVVIPEGLYPANVVQLEVFDTQSGGKRFKTTFKLADKVAELTIPKVTKIDNEYVNVVDENGDLMEVSGAAIAGKQINATVFVTPNPPKGEGWKNRKYIDFCQSLNVDFPNVEGKIKVMEIEESDILGKPALIKVAARTWESAEGTNVTMQVDQLFPWPEGETLDAADLDGDIPF